ncbi:ribonucleotide-diphosphate reductase subunit beta [Nocardia macrotermitis]|uniref:Uncharacterized protein n=1 Tax=Nocardia macrotermitis TaxID=2585198 RepID=A0A7K0DA17_9NOCA|nr:ribonucleotide-diphosphate reductase subunit beta [Nocardia macrotermitis]MQY22605.1 hypothetical protein [Nocardia macrotermitis]
MTTTLASNDQVLDVTDIEPETPVRIADSASLYRRWERQQWAVAAVDPARDATKWQELSDFSREQMLGALSELEVGEVTVTHTLGALIDAPPSEDDRIFLCTQLADEARHVRFFQTYLESACGVGGSDFDTLDADASADYAQVFTPVLTAATGAVRKDNADTDSWFRALIYYHLITEGVLAATALRTTRLLAKRLALPALDEGLTNVTRDESRHVSYGLWAAANGVANGHRDIIADAHFESLGAAATVLIGPSRFNPVPAIGLAARIRAAHLSGGVAIARSRLLKQLRLIGLPDLTERAARAWDAAIEAALDAYEQRWDSPHPIRAVA